MLDREAKKILKLNSLFRRSETRPRVFKGGPPQHRLGTPMSQKQLNALRDHGVPAGKVLKAWRSKAMKRKRLKMKIKKAIALEAHELQQMARENATLAMRTLISISENPRAPEATRIAASSVILDRAYGKASQTSITASVTNGKADTIDGSELDKRVARALKRVEELTDRTPKAPASQKRLADIRKYN